MTIIEIKVDILNSPQVVIKEKGKFLGFMAGIFMDKNKLKRKVEAKVCEEVIKKLQESLNTGLEEQGIIANISFSLLIGESETAKGV